MGEEVGQGREGGGEMSRRRVRLADGRYLIFYTFGAEAEAPGEGRDGVAARPGPDAAASAEEERLV